MMRFHVVSLPHTHPTRQFVSCAFTEKVRRFCIMMKALGHTVYLYAGEQNEAPCDELITCIGEEMRAAAVGRGHYTSAPFDPKLPHWQTFNRNVIDGIRKRAQPRDFICVISGRMCEPIAAAFPAMMTVEFGVGYGGHFAKYRVWESYAWMHTCYGAATGGNANDADGAWFDAVIPGYLEPEMFTPADLKGDYLLFVGRMTERKGLQAAVEVAKATGKRLVMAGPGVPPSDPCVEYVGVVGPEQRRNLMASAIALLVPTIYVEPFGNVAIEAMACGTPVLSTDWGAMTETVIPGVTGFRCRTLAEFCDGVARAPSLDPHVIRKHVIDNYSLDVIGPKYGAYFERLSTLWGAGWYEMGHGAAPRVRCA